MVRKITQQMLDATIGSRKSITATGSVTDGDVVVLNNDATVSAVGAVPAVIGTPAVFESAAIAYNDVCYVDTDKVVVIYEDEGNSDHATYCVGTISDTTITWGTPAVMHATGMHYHRLCYLGGGTIIATYREIVGNTGHVVAGTISGTTITWGTPVTTSVNSIECDVVAIDSSTFVHAHWDHAVDLGKAAVGTVSGTTITLNAYATFESSYPTSLGIDYLGNNKVVIGWRRASTLAGQCIVGTISGNTISFGAAAEFNSGATQYVRVATVDADTFVVSYQDVGNLGYGTANVGTVSGTIITFGAKHVFEPANTFWTDIAHVGGGKIVVVYTDVGNSSFGTLVSGTVSGTAISFDTPQVFNSAGSNYPTIDAAGTDRVVISYEDSGNTQFGTGLVYKTPSTNCDAWLGICESTVSDAEASIAMLGATVTNQSGLSVNGIYFVANDGSLTTTDTGRKIGRALSATDLLITQANA